MRKTLPIICALLLTLDISLHAGLSGKLGFGLMLGEPSGICFKLWKDKVNAFSGGLAFGRGLNIHLDYLWHDYNIVAVEEGRIPVYYGFGVKFNADADIGLRGVFGFTSILRKAPFDIFFEFVPVYEFTPKSNFTFTAAAGIRFYPSMCSKKSKIST